MNYKATPVLVADGVLDAAELKPRFLAAAQALPAEICALVLVRLGGENGNGQQMPGTLP